MSNINHQIAHAAARGDFKRANTLSRVKHHRKRAERAKRQRELTKGNSQQVAA